MSGKPLVSVLMTSYNREKYIAEAIESVLSSTYTYFELIIVDDQSKDSTVEIAQGFAAKDSRVKVYLNEQNLGDYPNRNKAASYAKGKYLKYVDADDLIYPHGLQVLVDMMEKFPEAGYGICTIAPHPEQMFPICLSPKQAYEYHYIKNGQIFFRAPLSGIINKEVFKQVNGFIHQRMVGDFELWHRLSLKFPVVIMPQGIIWNRVHGEQEMGNHSKYLMEYLIIAEKYINSSDLGTVDKLILLDKIRRKQFITLIKNPMKFNVKQKYLLYNNSNIRLSRILANSTLFKIFQK